MGFFNKIKNFVTGGAATVNLIPSEQIFDGSKPIKLRVECKVGDTDVKIRKVYLKVRAVEEVVAKDIDVVRDEEGGRRTYREDVRSSAETYNTEIQVEGAQEISANQSKTWEVEFQIPGNVNGTYRGVNATHEWKVMAGLDMSGNDPDSGWLNIEVKK